MNRMEALKRWGGSNSGRKRRVEAKGTPYRERKGRVEREELKGKGTHSVFDKV